MLLQFRQIQSEFQVSCSRWRRKGTGSQFSLSVAATVEVAGLLPLPLEKATINSISIPRIPIIPKQHLFPLPSTTTSSISVSLSPVLPPPRDV